MTAPRYANCGSPTTTAPRTSPASGSTARSSSTSRSGPPSANGSPTLAKGDKVVLSGRLKWSEWDSTDGKRQAIEILADSIVPNHHHPRRLGTHQNSGANTKDSGANTNPDEDDIPSEPPPGGPPAHRIPQGRYTRGSRVRWRAGTSGPASALILLMNCCVQPGKPRERRSAPS